MSCRIIREWIDACDDKHLEEVLDHIDQCPACQIYFDNKTNLEDQLKTTYDYDGDFDSKKKDILLSTSKKRNYKKYLVIAAILIVLIVPNGQNIYALVEDIPLVGDLLKYFVVNESAETAKEHDYPVQDLILEKDGYTLYINDLYVDPYMGKFTLALEKDKAFIKTFDYYIIQNDQKTGIYPGHIEATPWKDASVYKDPETDLDFQVQVEIGDQVVLFDHIKVSSATIDKVPVKKVSIDETIESKYGTYTLSHLDVYPTGMYLHLTYDVPEDVYMFHLMDLKLESNDRIYEQSFISKKVDDTKKRWIRFDESFYYEDINTIDLSLRSLKVKTIKEELSSHINEIEGKKITYDYGFKDVVYSCNSANYKNNLVTLNFVPQTVDRIMFPMSLAIYQNNEWTYLDDKTVNEEFFSKDEQEISIPTFVLNKWSGLNVEKIIESNDGFSIIEKEEGFDPYYAYRESKVYKRDYIESLITTFAWDVTEEELDLIFMSKESDALWLNKVDLELISGMPFDQIKNSDDAKIKLLEYIAEHAYTFRELFMVEHILESIEDYGKIGLGGHALMKMISIDYRYIPEDVDQPISLGLMKVHMIYPEIKKTLEIK